MKLLMARHGQSAWQVHGDVAGDDAPLTHMGELQAHRLGEYLARYEPVSRMIGSSLMRAHQTAEIVSSYLELPVQVEADLREFDDWEAGWAPQPTAIWDARPSDPDLSPGYGGFRQRIAALLARLLDNVESGEPVLFVAHGGTIGTMLRILMGSDTPRMWVWNTALTKIEWERSEWGDAWKLHYFNRLEHLPHFMRTF